MGLQGYNQPRTRSATRRALASQASQRQQQPYARNNRSGDLVYDHRHQSHRHQQQGGGDSDGWEDEEDEGEDEYSSSRPRTPPQALNTNNYVYSYGVRAPLPLPHTPRTPGRGMRRRQAGVAGGAAAGVGGASRRGSMSATATPNGISSPAPRAGTRGMARYAQDGTSSGRSSPPPLPHDINNASEEPPSPPVVVKPLLRFIITYTGSILHTALSLLRTPLSWLVCLFILAFLVQRMTTTLHATLAPFCRIPFAGRLSLCSVDHNAQWSSAFPRNEPQVEWTPDFPSLINVQTKTFSQLLDESVKGNALSLEVKKAEMASKDLIVLVKHSDLKAKDMLAERLGVFVESAAKVGKGLQRLDSKIGGAVDNIMAVNEYALQSIASAQADTLSVWSPLGLVVGRGKKKEEQVGETFAEAMNTLSINMERLILEAESRQMDLNKLEEDLEVVHGILTREDQTLVQEKETKLHGDVLATLWTALGGNNKRLRNFEENLAVLRNLGVYREQALAHVVGALQVLRGMSADMEDLRERVAMPELVGEKIPVEVHMRSIQMGIERLRDGRVRAKALEEDVMRRVMARHGLVES